MEATRDFNKSMSGGVVAGSQTEVVLERGELEAVNVGSSSEASQPGGTQIDMLPGKSPWWPGLLWGQATLVGEVVDEVLV